MSSSLVPIDAYVVIFPNPDSYQLGIARSDNEPGGNVFWFKVGDAVRALSREENYRSWNPSYKFIAFKVLVKEDDEPGKLLEIASGLEETEMGTNGEGDHTEWHSLYSKADKSSVDLFKTLEAELKTGEPLKFDSAKDSLVKVIEAHNHKRRQDPNSGVHSETVVKESKGVAIIVTPSIHPDAKSFGIDLGQDHHMVWIQIKEVTGSKTVKEAASDGRRTHSPTFLYNVRSLKEDTPASIAHELGNKLGITLEQKDWWEVKLDGNMAENIRNYVKQFYDK